MASSLQSSVLTHLHQTQPHNPPTFMARTITALHRLKIVTIVSGPPLIYLQYIFKFYVFLYVASLVLHGQHPTVPYAMLPESLPLCHLCWVISETVKL
jgi:hypothetical protein